MALLYILHCTSYTSIHTWNITISGFEKHIVIMEFYFRFQFWPYHCSRHIILHQSPKFHPNWTAHGRKMTLCRFSRCRISAILDFMGPIIDSLKSPCRTSYRSSIETIALNCFVVFFAFLCTRYLATDGQTDRQPKRSKPPWLSRVAGLIML